MILTNPRRYGNPPYSIVLVHGGPGAPGEMAPVARELSQKFGVLEPLQTQNSIKGQVAELKRQITENAQIPVILIGWSWGAWLSFILSAENPNLVKKLILISSGPFEAKYAEKIMPTRLSRLTSEERIHLETLTDLREFGQLMAKADAYDAIPNSEVVEVQADIYNKVWTEADELRRSGKLLEYGKSITCPVTVVHGDYDPHPYDGVKEPLSKVINKCKFVLLEKCGHHPWLERESKDNFYKVLVKELI